MKIWSDEDLVRLQTTVSRLRVAELRWRTNRKILMLSLVRIIATIVTMIIITGLETVRPSQSLMPLVIATSGICFGIAFADHRELTRKISFRQSRLWQSMANAMIMSAPDYARTVGDMVILKHLADELEKTDNINERMTAVCQTALEVKNQELRQALFCVIQLMLFAKGRVLQTSGAEHN